MDFMAGAGDGGLPNGNPIAQAVDAVGGFAGGAADPFEGMPMSGAGMGGPAATAMPEMTKLREWETQHEEELEGIARKEAAAKEEARQAAAAELAKWREEKQAEVAKRLTVNRVQERELEAGREAALMPGANPWELVVDLIDTTSRTVDESSDTSRMRSLLIQLKSSPALTA